MKNLNRIIEALRPDITGLPPAQDRIARFGDDTVSLLYPVVSRTDKRTGK